MLVSVYIDYFNAIGNDFLAQKRANQARLVFERAVQFLNKQKNPAPYQQALLEFEALLAQAKSLSVEQTQPNAGQDTELIAAVAQEDEDDAQWKKKQIYD